MNSRILFLAALLAAAPLSLKAQSANDRFHCQLELTGSFSINSSVLVPESSLECTAGWRLLPRLTLAGGIGGSTIYSQRDPSTPALSLPLFARIICDLTPGRIFPYVSADLGYAFMLPNGDSGKQLKIRYMDNGAPYLPACEALDWYGPDGPFARLALGVGFRLGGHALRLGLSAGGGQYFHGCWSTDDSGHNSRFGRPADYEGEAVILQNRPRLGSSLRFTCTAGLGFEF